MSRHPETGSGSHPAPAAVIETSEAAEPWTSVASAEPWRKLNPLMLVVHPARELIKYLPVLVIALIAGSVGGEPWWAYALSGLGVVIGILQWFTTAYRITETHVEVRRGILNRRRLSVRRERIRSVDVDSTLLHRVFGLSVVKVGTGASHGTDGLEFNGVSTRDVPELRRVLLSSSRHDDAGHGVASGEDAVDRLPAQPGGNLSDFSRGWARYAPFTLAGVASIALVAMFVLQIQFFENGVLTRLPVTRWILAWLSHIPVSTIALWALLGLVVVASLVAVIRYLLSYSHFSIARTDRNTLHVSHGLLRTRQVTLDENRMRGVQLAEPLSLRLVGASSAHAIMTGIGRERGGVTLIDPPGPRQSGRRVAAAVLGSSEPLDAGLGQHGPRATRRRYTRALLAVGLLAGVSAVLEFAGILTAMVWLAFIALVPFAGIVAWDRARGLGHALVGPWLVIRSGSLARRRVVLTTDGIIGWTIRRSFFQRRAGLATLIATTAAGRHRYGILDLPMDQVWPLIESISGPNGSVAVAQADPELVSSTRYG